jgi:hypothetical protein
MAAENPRNTIRASQFLALIERSDNPWRIETQPAESDDISGLPRIVFYLDGDEGRLATVERSHERLLVCFRRRRDRAHDCYFALARLDELAEHDLAWRRKIEGDFWVRPEHLRLLDELHALFN